MERSLGVGLDLPWGAPIGFDPATDAPTPRVGRFLARHAFTHAFGSWQPRDRSRLDAGAYAAAWDALSALLPPVRGLHHTALNLGALVPYDRRPAIELANALIERCGLRWVNEDLGLWSLCGRPLPYPLPPFLTEDGVAAATRNTAEAAAGLRAPLLVEFPGFEHVAVGDIDAYDAFRRVVEGAGVGCTLDTGHLLSWRAYSGQDLLGGLDRLPLAHCVEIHLAGAAVRDGVVLDLHHGVLAREQLVLLEELLERCPHVRLVTWEDPKFDDDGVLPGPAEESLGQLREIVDPWARLGGAGVPPRGAGVSPAADVPPAAPALEHALDRVLLDPTALRALEQGDDLGQPALRTARRAGLRAASRKLRRQALERAHRGVGSLRQRFRLTLGPDPDATIARFCASVACLGWTEVGGAVPGTCLEEAFYRFCESEGVGDPATREAEFAEAIVLALATSPNPSFGVPPEARRVRRGWIAVTRRRPAVFAVIDGKLIRGAVTPFLVDLLASGLPLDIVAGRHGVDPRTASAAAAEALALGLAA